jgi:hypothetical protein
MYHPQDSGGGGGWGIFPLDGGEGDVIPGENYVVGVGAGDGGVSSGDFAVAIGGKLFPPRVRFTPVNVAIPFTSATRVRFAQRNATAGCRFSY